MCRVRPDQVVLCAVGVGLHRPPPVAPAAASQHAAAELAASAKVKLDSSAVVPYRELLSLGPLRRLMLTIFVLVRIARLRLPGSFGCSIS